MYYIRIFNYKLIYKVTKIIIRYKEKNSNYTFLVIKNAVVLEFCYEGYIYSTAISH